MIVAANFIKELEIALDSSFRNIALMSCYSAAEIMDPESHNYFNAPARLLSLALPEKNILGFVGKFNDAKVAVVDADGKQIQVGLIDGSIVFRDGWRRRN